MNTVRQGDVNVLALGADVNIVRQGDVNVLVFEFVTNIQS